MKHEDFKIGTRFTNGAFDWVCTDVGTRVIIAIRVSLVEIESMTADGVKTVGMMLEDEAQAAGWFNGPPYAVEEDVFDEYDIPVLTVISDGRRWLRD